MKRFIAVILMLLCLMVMSGCKDSNANIPATDSTPTTTQSNVPMKTVYLPLTETYTYSTGETKAITYLYDENGHLTGINHGIGPKGDEMICTVVCDTNGCVTQIKHAGFNKEKQEFTYDELWRIATLTNKYTTSQYLYTLDGKIEKIILSNGWCEQYTYVNGLLTETAIYNSKGEKETWITFEYDSQGRITKKQQCSDGCLPEEGVYTYSDDGLSYTLVFGGATQIFTYDENGNLVCKEFISDYLSYKCVYTYQPIEIPENLQWVPYQDNYCN